jgi:hypothetical protein
VISPQLPVVSCQLSATRLNTQSCYSIHRDLRSMSILVQYSLFKTHPLKSDADRSCRTLSGLSDSLIRCLLLNMSWRERPARDPCTGVIQNPAQQPAQYADTITTIASCHPERSAAQPMGLLAKQQVVKRLLFRGNFYEHGGPSTPYISLLLMYCVQGDRALYT